MMYVLFSMTSLYLLKGAPYLISSLERNDNATIFRLLDEVLMAEFNVNVIDTKHGKQILRTASQGQAAPWPGNVEGTHEY